ncbi:hypothetical protein [Roseateles paludis]|uniref:Cellulose synthase operon C C-terminal domain-containing protein n=1 Tax=Roseateles paludis TaxID=3145238 RepID=A0ABV0FVQ6_9BURK
MVRPASTRPAAIEANWTAVKMPDGGRTAFASISYLMAVNDDWGFGPGVYGTAKGNYGGIFTAGFTAQRRWRLGANTHLATSLYVGAGGGLSSSELRFGGGLMLRPEISLRTEQGAWYSGLSLAQIRFPGGNVKGTALGFSLGRSTDFGSFSPLDAGRRGASSGRTGLGIDEIAFTATMARPRAGLLRREGSPLAGTLGFAGADLRQYVAEGSWWGVEASGAAKGGVDGYMEVLGQIGQDWQLAKSALGQLRVGGQLAGGLGGGGGVNTGSGWLLRAGPSLRWVTPWGASLRLEGGATRSYSGTYRVNFWRAALSMPLDRTPATAFNGQGDEGMGTVREQQLGLSTLVLPRVRFKDGRRETVGELAVSMRRELSDRTYGVAYAGSAAKGSAGAYSFGLFGAGVQSRPLTPNSNLRVGAEALVGAAGGGGVQVGGGAVMQAEAWAEWRPDERLRLRAGAGQWRTLRSHDQRSALLHLNLSYAYGSLQR